LKIKPVWVFIVIGVISVPSWLYFSRRVSVPKSSAEFFKDNPHLQPRAYAESELPDLYDAKKELGPLDLHFKSGKAYRLSVENTSTGITPGSESEHPRKFILELEPDDLKNGAYFMKVSPKGLVTRFKDSIVLKVAPAGGIQKIFLKSKFKPEDQAGLEAMIRALFTAFMPRPPKDSAVASVRIEPLAGPIFSMQSTVKASQEGYIEWLLRREAGIHSEEARLRWSNSLSLPVEIEINSQAIIPIKKGSTQKISAKEQIRWVGFSSTLDFANIAKAYPFELDLNEFRKGLRLRLNQASLNAGKTDVPKDWKEIRERLIRIAPSPNIDPVLAKAISEQVFMQLTESLQGRPDLVDDVIGLLREGGSDQMKDTLLGALGYEGSPKAQKAMLEFFQSGASKSQKQKIISSWAVGATPLIPEVKGQLLALAQVQGDPNSNQAALALGASIPRDGDPGTILIFKNAFNRNDPLIGRGDDQQVLKRQVIIAGMGNARSEVFLPEIERALRDPEPLVRAEAVNSLRFIPKEEVLQKIFSYLENRSEPGSVRAAAASALKYRIEQPGVSERLMSAGRTDESNEVRQSCNDALLGLSSDPTVQSYLRSRAQSDPDPGIRESLKNAGW